MSTTMSGDALTGRTDRDAALRGIADAIAEAVAKDPAAGVVPFATRGGCVDRIGARIRIGRHTVRQDEPEGFGGTDAAPNPVEYALAAEDVPSSVELRWRPGDHQAALTVSS